MAILSDNFKAIPQPVVVGMVTRSDTYQYRC
jgi:hypothetical protein